MQREFEKLLECWSHWNRPAVRRRPSFMGWLLQEYIETWQKPWSNTMLYAGENLKESRKTHLTHRIPSAGQEKCINVRKMWVSALFSAFLRCFEPRELAKLVGQQNLFRDLGFFFFSFLKTFPSDNLSKGVYLEEWEGELGMWKSARLQLSGKGE